MVVIFDLCLGQGGLLDRAPHHRPQPAIERSVQQKLPDLAGDGGFGGEVHRGIAPGPVAQHAQPGEFLALHVQPVGGIGAALGAEIQHRHVVLLASALVLAAGVAILLLDLPFDRQAVAVPARNVVGIASGHLRGAIDHVLQNLVQRMPDMQVAVRIGRPVMQDEGRAALGLRPQPLPQPDARPAFQHRRLPLGQVAAHGEGRVGQEHGAAVVARLGGCVVHGAWVSVAGEAAGCAGKRGRPLLRGLRP